MDDLDKTLDIMERDKVTSLLQENSVRTKKNNIKFTKQNKKYSQEHLDAQLTSYERLVRNLIKQLLNLEKKVRLKYLIPINDNRELKLMGWWNTEVECAIEDLIKNTEIFIFKEERSKNLMPRFMKLKLRQRVKLKFRFRN